MLKCDAQGRIKFSTVLTAVNSNTANSTGIANAVNTNTAGISANGALIADHEKRLAKIETAGGTLPALAARVTTVEGEIVKIKDSVTLVKKDIVTLTASIGTVDAKVDVNTKGIAANVTDISAVNKTIAGLVPVSLVLTAPTTTNKIITEKDVASQVSKLTNGYVNGTTSFLATKTYVDGLYGTSSYSVIGHVAPMGSGGGTSAPGSWQVRIIDTPIEDNLSILQPGNKIELAVGKYEVEGFAQSTGAYHQARLQNETTNKTLVLGSSGKGISILNGAFNIKSVSTLSLQSRVDTAVASNGYGLPNPFGEGIFTSLKIRRVGA